MKSEIGLSNKSANLILLFINLLFAYKYISRADVPAYLIVPFYAFFIIAGIYYFTNKNNFEFLNKIYWLPIAAFAAVHILGFFLIDVHSLKVDRWSIITGFWDNVFSGNYPYFPITEGANPPGPMPFYFILAFPFYLIGEIGFYSLSGMLIFIWFLKRNFGINNDFYLSIFLLFTSIALNWEIAVRSTILINSVLMLIYFDNLLNIKKFNTTKIVLFALTGGLLLSTRSIYILIFTIYFIYSLRYKVLTLSQICLFIILAAFAFLAPLGIMYLFYPNEFPQMNPLIVQSEFLIPSYYIILFLIIAAILALFVRNEKDVFLYSGFSLFISILIYFVYHVINSGFAVGYLGSKADISYFIFSMPFLIYSISAYKKIKF